MNEQGTRRSKAWRCSSHDRSVISSPCGAGSSAAVSPPAGPQPRLWPAAAASQSMQPLACALILGLLLPPSAATSGDLDTIRSRLFAESMPSTCSDVCRSATGFASSMQSDGSWKDIKYKDTDRTVWADVTHWNRLKSLSEALHCKACGPAGGKEALLPKIVAGMRFWKANNFLDPNWCVSILKMMNSILKMMDFAPK